MMDNELSFVDALHSDTFSNADGKIPIIVGKYRNHDVVIRDIAQFPHLLIAGATGTGKSTLAQGILLSLIKKKSPDDVRLILCDTKILEFSLYNGCPHLMIPIATDAEEISKVIQWACKESLQRLKLISKAGCRDVEAYNNSYSGDPIARVVIVIDDISNALIDSNTIGSFQKVIQTGKSTGIHFILITQTPSNKAIASTIRSSIPVRAVFNVFTSDDEKLLLDTKKNNYLSDVGEIIFCDMRSSQKEKISCFMVSESDIETVLEEAREKYTSETSIQNIKDIYGTSKDELSDDLIGDEMLPAAVDVIFETGQTSVAMIQRRLKLGYARASRILDEMEEKGIVGPFLGSKPRAILITKEQWDKDRGVESQPDYIEQEQSVQVEEVKEDSHEDSPIMEQEIPDDNTEIDPDIHNVSDETIFKTETVSKKDKALRLFRSFADFLKNAALLILGSLWIILTALKNDPDEQNGEGKILTVIAIIGIICIVGGVFSHEKYFILLGIGFCAFAFVSVIRWLVISIISIIITCAALISLRADTDDRAVCVIVAALSFCAFVYFACKFIHRAYGNIVMAVRGVSIDKIDKMSGLEFEKFTARLLRQLGYKDVTVTKSSGDQGIDVLASKDGLRYAIQCKNYSRKLDNTPVQEAYTGKVYYRCDVAVVLTNNYFTSGAIELARKTGVVLWDRDVLKQMIKK